MNYMREVSRLALCGLMTKDEVAIRALSKELERTAGVANITPTEVVQAISSLIDSPIKDKTGHPVFVNIGHIKTRVDYYREQAARKSKDDGFRLMRENWAKDGTGVPPCWPLQMVYLAKRDPSPADKAEVLDAIREEMLQHPKGSELYRLWEAAGIIWRDVR